MHFQTFSIINNGTRNRKLVIGIHRKILILVIFDLGYVILHHFQIKFQFLNLICYAFFLLLRGRELIKLVKSFLELYLFHLVVITLGLSALKNCKSIVYHLFKFEHEDFQTILTVLNDVTHCFLPQSRMASETKRASFFDIEFLHIGNEIANQSDSSQIIRMAC